MARNQQPSWVSNLQYPANGIGDLHDLKFTPIVGDASKWTLGLDSGWYYLNSENFYYLSEGSQVFPSQPLGVNSITISESLNPGWGPVLIEGTTYDYTPLGSYLSPAETVTWTASGNNIYYYDLPSTSRLVQVRDLTTLPMAQVSNISLLSNPKLYAYDSSLHRVYVLSTGAPSNEFFIDTLVFNPSIQIKELLWIEDSQVNLTFLPASDITLTRGTSSTAFATATGSLTPGFGIDGDWVLATYYHDYSYVVQDETTVVTYAPVIDNVTVRWEQASPTSKQLVVPANDPSNKLDLNPINPNSYGPGYLLLTNETLQPPAAKSITVKTNKQKFVPDWGEEVNVSIRVYDINGLPIPGKSLTIVHNGVQENTFDTSMTNKQGEVYLRLSGSSTLTIAASSDLVIDSTLVEALEGSSLVTSDLISDGRASLVVTNDLDARGNLISYASASQLDGIPKSSNINIRAKKSSSIFYEEQEYKRVASIPTFITSKNPGGISPSFGIIPDKGDKLNATTTNGQSKIIEVTDV